MAKGEALTLIILILTFSFGLASCDNNSSIKITQSNSAANVTGESPSTSSNNISDRSETSSAEKFDELDLSDKILSIIVNILEIGAILAALVLWLFPSARNRIRNKIVGLLKKIGLIKNDSEGVQIDLNPQNVVSRNLIKLPYPANPNFTGREKYLSELARSLVQAASGPQIFALVGNGGMGKTQIALKHARRPENCFKYVWWLRAEEPTTLLDDYISIAEDLMLPGWNLRDTDQTIKIVKRWLEDESISRWLLVFDNAQKPEDLMRYIPAAGAGQIIITSRQSVWEGIAKTLDVGGFQRDENQDESVDFLFKRTEKDDKKGAALLARELGDMPLALEQAAAYIKETGISFSDYLTRFKEDRKKLLCHGKPLNYPDTVATTWEISFQAVKKENCTAGDLLNLCAFLAPDAIPRRLLEEGAERLPETLATCAKNASELDDCIAVLKRYSQINAADNLISVHRLVQAVVQDRLSSKEQKTWAESALKLVNGAFTFSQLDEETWEKCSKLSSHAFSASEHAERLGISPQETARLMNDLGNYLHNRMELAPAKSVLERALKIDEKALGPEHTSVARDVNNLGSVMQDLGDLEGAKMCFERALKIDEKALGPEHTSVARDVNNLGLVKRDLGDLVGAKMCFERALAISEKRLGKDHPKTVLVRNNLKSLQEKTQ